MMVLPIEVKGILYLQTEWKIDLCVDCRPSCDVIPIKVDCMVDRVRQVMMRWLVCKGRSDGKVEVVPVLGACMCTWQVGVW